MKMEVTAQGKSVEAAVEAGALELGVDQSKVEYEVLTAPKKGFLGLGEVMAKVIVRYSPSPAEVAYNFVCTLLDDMNLDADAELEESDGAATIKINGDDAGILIGHHGDTLDSLQYLASLAANKKSERENEDDYTKITVDIGDYRAKREETLRALARRMAARVKKYGRSIALEPMNPYERRIIHSEIQGIAGVTTNSIGAENNRKIVIYLDN